MAAMESLGAYSMKSSTSSSHTNNNNEGINHNIDNTMRDFDSKTIDLCMLSVESVISQGSISSVFKASYYGQDVVVKVLVVEQLCQRAKDSVKKLFDGEVSMWSMLDHPNIIKFVGASRDLCMVSEYLHGGTLKSYLSNAITYLSLKTVIQLALDLARGLSYLHSKDIVHGDVKIENMILDERHQLKIADFGVPRLVSLVQGKMIGQAGRLGCMAPEVRAGKPYDTKCDVYSFGICLWEIYCCKTPFSPPKFANEASTVYNKDLRPEIPKWCPKSLAKIMKRCWSSNPKKRPEMKDVVSSLECIDTSKGGGMTSNDQAHCSCFFH
ncbi:serine/threonine-protein kinase STY13 [Spinacia oleracea]|uniref:Serine/threonine-protein kinase STY13 n=1 Tax=Spinacia oleracea TaxID=3562 RepID=A0A9R0I5U6_SPIOL|nr:serine/threonine-protein kinase STY13-like [Spinacia oleracea]